MIKFKLYRNIDDKIIRFTVKGHANYADEGYDIVCAAVSTAVWMTANGIEEQALATIKYVQEDGFVDCVIDEEREEGADLLLNSLDICIRELAKQYKEYLFIMEV